MYACNYLTTQECKFSTDKQKLALLRPYIVSFAIFLIEFEWMENENDNGVIVKIYKS